MKYYYLTAEGSPAGPETLETLTAIMAQGVVSPATMVVPAGGEDWTPLARVLRYFYPDDTGTTIGPVAFSELNRLNQIAALDGEAWVLEEGGTEWKALSSILEAGGVAVAAPVQQVSRIPGVFRPPAAGAAASRDGVNRPPAVRRAMGGLRRGAFFLGLLLVLVFLVAALIVTARVTATALDKMVDPNAWEGIFVRYLLALKLIFLAACGGLVLCLALRLKNIGWSFAWLLIYVLPVVLPLLSGLMEFKSWMIGAWGLSILAGMALFIPVASLPPGYKRHRRLDTAAKVLPIVILLAYGGLFAWGYDQDKKAQKRRAEESQKNPEKPADTPESPAPAP